MAQLKITLLKSTIGIIPRHKKTVAALGLRKVNSTTTQEDNKAIRGMVHQVRHLLAVEPLQ